ncbi:elongin A, like [Gymnodraco acuticeps]|uniref:Elongin A, like n=1 Tax=Gymnodraco acuticeps TaxID=8218 RepID=A0A6P8TJT5_GYMAC|nr:elongin A, like [Gymnodraco acuticeps]
MASSSDVVKKVARYKLQLTDTAESATVVKILQKLKDLDITFDILAETGIGKAVNSFRRHKQGGELAKSLVRGWKDLVPKESTSHTENGICESLPGKDQKCQNNGSLTIEDSNNNCLPSYSKNSSDEALFKTSSEKADTEKQCKVGKRHKDQDENQGKSQETQDIVQNEVLKKYIQTKEDQIDDYVVSKKKKSDESKRKSGDTVTLPQIKNSEDTHRKSRSEKKSNEQQKESSKQAKESFSFKSIEKHSETFRKLASFKHERSPEISRSSEGQNKKTKKTGKETQGSLKHKYEQMGHSKNKKAKIELNDEKKGCEESSLSFESFLNYDGNASKRKQRSGVKKPSKTIKTVVKATQDAAIKPNRSPMMSINDTSPTKTFKESVMELIPFAIPLPDLLPECENQFTVDYFEKKDEKEPDLCEVSEESAGFTGQRLNKKMQVYSGAKTVFLPAMMSLHQQCIRALQNNINLLYETGGVPFEILEPVLERCTPQQLLHIEECNPIYIGETDHLWGKHCQRDFKNSRLQEYESWKEMYVRLSEERERKLKRLTKSIVSANSTKPKGRQVKMAFIHTVAKPPRDVRIKQELHGTASQPQPQVRCSVKVPDSRPKPSCNEPSRSSSSSSGPSNTQDPRKKTRVAPMMAKSLRAFRNQLGRR